MTDIVNRLRDEDPECGLRLSIATEAADRIEALELALWQIARAKSDPCDKFCGVYLDLQAVALKALEDK